MPVTHPAVPWLARWVRTERFLLAARAARVAVRESPFYQALPEVEVGAAFAVAYGVLADALELNDWAPLRSYISEITAARMAAGSRQADVRALAEVLLSEVREELAVAAETEPQAVAAQRFWPTIERVVWEALGPFLSPPPGAPGSPPHGNK